MPSGCCTDAARSAEARLRAGCGRRGGRGSRRSTRRRAPHHLRRENTTGQRLRFKGCNRAARGPMMSIRSRDTHDGCRAPSLLQERPTHPPDACGWVSQSTGSRRRLKPCTRPGVPLLNFSRDWFLVGGAESSDGRKLPAVTEAVTFSRLRKIPGWKGQPEDIRWRPRPPQERTTQPSPYRLGFVVSGLQLLGSHMHEHLPPEQIRPAAWVRPRWRRDASERPARRAAVRLMSV